MHIRQLTVQAMLLCFLLSDVYYEFDLFSQLTHLLVQQEDQPEDCGRAFANGRGHTLHKNDKPLYNKTILYYTNVIL